MTGLVELSLCRGISPFQSYLLHPNNVDAAESFRSSSIASIMVAQEPWPRSSASATIGMPAFIASANDATMIRGRNARNSAWLRRLETVDLLPIWRLADPGAARFSQRVPDYRSIQPSKFDRFYRNAPSTASLSFLERTLCGFRLCGLWG